MSVVDLLIPIVVSAVALFFAGFVSWMVAGLHRADWIKMDNEDTFLESLRSHGLGPGNYMFPGMESPKDMETEEFKEKQEKGPNGIITIFPSTAMGPKLVKTFIYNLVVSFCIAYLASVALEPGDEFMKVFRFIATSVMITFLAGIVNHAIWFNNRIVGHIVEAIVYGLMLGAIFAGLWPAA